MEEVLWILGVEKNSGKCAKIIIISNIQQLLRPSLCPIPLEPKKPTFRIKIIIKKWSVD